MFKLNNETVARINQYGNGMVVEIGKSYRTIKRGTVHTVTQFTFNAFLQNGYVGTVRNDDGCEYGYELDEFIEKFVEVK